MGLFDQIVGAIENPSQQASPDQIGSILGAVEGLATSRGVDPTAAQMALSVVGNYVRSALQDQRAAGGSQNAEQIVNQYGSTHPNPDAVGALFSPQQQQQVAQAVSQRTGIDANTIVSLLPVLVPLVLNLLKSGANAHQAQGTASNSVLNTFLDADGDGDVDVGDAVAMAGRYLSQR